jgi:hypothetical protein
VLISCQLHQIGGIQRHHQRTAWPRIDAKALAERCKAAMGAADQACFEGSWWRIEASVGDCGVGAADPLANITARLGHGHPYAPFGKLFEDGASNHATTNHHCIEEPSSLSIARTGHGLVCRTIVDASAVP